jgi:hypothetical protein
MRALRTRKAAVAAAAFAVGGLLAVLAVSAATHAGSAHRPRVAPAVIGPPTDASVQTAAQALAAGVDDATLLARLFPLDPVAARVVLAGVSSDAHRDELVAAAAAELAPLQRQVAALPGTAVYREAVLAAQLAAYSPPTARVAAWLMLTVGQAGVDDNATATFATVSVELVFEHDAWKLDATAETPGPSPEVHDAPTSVDAFVARLAGFADWRPAP